MEGGIWRGWGLDIDCSNIKRGEGKGRGQAIRCWEITRPRKGKWKEMWIRGREVEKGK